MLYPLAELELEGFNRVYDVLACCVVDLLVAAELTCGFVVLVTAEERLYYDLSSVVDL